MVQGHGNAGSWLGFCENLLLTIGGWILFTSFARPEDKPSAVFGASNSGALVARLLFGASCVVFGLSHFVYTNATASMVPAWLPNRVFFAYLTGAGHFSAGVAILLGILPRLAATLEAAKISSFVLLVHLPGIVAEPKSRLQWTMLFVASALAGAAWVFASTLRGASWGWARRPEEATST